MPRREVSTRLSVEGDREFRQAFGRAGQAGEDALQRIDRASTGASRGMRAVNEAAERGRASIDGYASRLGAAGGVLRSIGPAGLAAAAGIAAIGVAAVASGRQMAEALGRANSIQDTADTIGITAERLQLLTDAFSQVGVEAETTRRGLTTFGERLGQAQQGAGAFRAEADRLGISLRNANGEFRSSQDILRDVIDQIEGAATQEERLAIARAAFGRSAVQFVNLFQQGNQEVDRLIAGARDAGITISNDVNAAAAGLNTRLSTTVTRMGQAFQAGLLENAVDNLNQATQNTDNLTRAARTLGEVMGHVVGFFADLVNQSAAIVTNFDRAMNNRPRQFQGQQLTREELRQTLSSVENQITANFSEIQELRRGNRGPAPGATIADLERDIQRLAIERAELYRLLSDVQSSHPLTANEVGRTSGSPAQFELGLDAFSASPPSGLPSGRPFRVRSNGLVPGPSRRVGNIVEQVEREAVGVGQTIQFVHEQAQRRTEQSFERIERDAERTASLAEQAFTSAFSRIEEAIVGAATRGGFAWQEMLTAIAADTSGLIIRDQITQPAVDALGQYVSSQFGGGSSGGFLSRLFGGGGGSQTIGGAIGNFIGGLFAHGAAFDRGVVQRFASGGVVDRPTYFNIGLMGEAGPEAIIPLLRGRDGRLGVAMVGGGGGGHSIYVDARGAIDPAAVEAAGYRGAQRALREAAPGIVHAAHVRTVSDWRRRGGRFS